MHDYELFATNLLSRPGWLELCQTGLVLKDRKGKQMYLRLLENWPYTISGQPQALSCWEKDTSQHALSVNWEPKVVMNSRSELNAV